MMVPFDGKTFQALRENIIKLRQGHVCLTTQRHDQSAEDSIQAAMCMTNQWTLKFQ